MVIALDPTTLYAVAPEKFSVPRVTGTSAVTVRGAVRFTRPRFAVVSMPLGVAFVTSTDPDCQLFESDQLPSLSDCQPQTACDRRMLSKVMAPPSQPWPQLLMKQSWKYVGSPARKLA